MATPGIEPNDRWELAPMGDRGLLLHWRGAIDQRFAAVQTLHRALRDASLPAVNDLVPGIESLLISYDPLELDTGDLLELIRPALRLDPVHSSASTRMHQIPVTYGCDEGPDLGAVAQSAGISVDEAVALHTGRPMPVLLIGFMPGFPYIGELPERLRVPRRDEPRHTVPAGSVAIANDQTGIYPRQSPGGWQLIGRTAFSLFDPRREPPTSIRPGDWVQFVAVDVR